MYIYVNNKKLDLKICNNFKDKLLGFMFKKNINYAILLNKCNSIHTFFMMEEIDVIMTDKNDNIVYIKNSLKPWKIILPKKNAYKTYELPKNTIKNLKIGDKIKLTP